MGQAGWGMKARIRAEDSRGVLRCAAGVFARLFFNKGFARVSPVFTAAALSAAFLVAPAILFANSSDRPTTTAESAADPAAAERRQAASSQFGRAEDQRAALNAKPGEKRTLNDYQQVVTSYRRVYLITPHASEVPDALLAVAELYTEMGDRFGRSYYQSAVDTYQFLMREYPKSRYLQDAYLRSAKLQKDQLGDTTGATKTYDAFLKKFPHAKRRREAQEARAELALLQEGQKQIPPSPERDPRVAVTNGVATARTSDARAGSTPGTSAIRKSAGTETARESSLSPMISRDVPSAPKESARSTARETAADETPDAGNEAATVASGKIPQVRRISAKSSGDSTRVTVELEGSVQYVSGRIANPDRIYFDLHAAKLAPQLIRGKIAVDDAMVSAIRAAQSPSGVVRVVLEVNGVKDYTASLLDSSSRQGPTQLVIDLYADAKTMHLAQAINAATDPPAPANAAIASAATTSTTAPDPAKPAATKVTSSDLPAATTSGNAIPEPKRTLGSAKSGKKPDLVQPTSSPQPTRDGQSTLTRALGLKIGRIVIDAGHGGHDTGTIGPTGLMEKDLCLDVALRLGKIIQQRLPGADVVFTRSDDTFIPLEERTHIANEAKADMFISIHANSSQDSGARGIETYYLNLKGSDEAMEVAARENATSEEGIHELQDLVKQIARTEKIDESKEFAEDVQDSLSKRIQKTARVVKNRGVRKAPFVVLIGADMPSILTEISFLSNPADEKLLKQPEHRQRVAEGIFQGIAGYLQSLNSMSVNDSGAPAPRKTTTSASSGVEAPRNRN